MKNIPCLRIQFLDHVVGFWVHQMIDKFLADGPVFPLMSWFLGVVRLQICSGSIRLPKYAEIQMTCGTYCRQDLFHNDTTVLREGELAGVRVEDEVAARQTFGRYGMF